jgi:hypothetical protein
LTQVARELAISVVNASSVFEMLVSVVGVGEHFPATLALVAVLGRKLGGEALRV